MLVVAAMGREVRPLVRSLSLQRGFLGDLPAWVGLRVAVAVVGVGPEIAGETTRRLLDAADWDRVLVVGVAGAADPSLAVGDLVVPETVVDRTTGDRFRPTTPSGLTAAGVLMTGSSLAVGPAVAADLRAAEVSAVDMETAAVARACTEHGASWSVLRAISDTLEDGLVDEDILRLTRPNGDTDLRAVAAYLGRRPAAAVRLARLGRGTAAAVRTLTAAAVPLCRPASPGLPWPHDR